MKSLAKYNGCESAGPMTKRVLGAGLLFVALLALALVFFAFDPAQYGFYPQCGLHKYTGLNCPGCGSLRALHHLTHGEFGAAFHCNPLLIALLPVFAFMGLRWLQLGREMFERDSILFRPATAYALLLATFAFTILRNLPGPAFAWMSP
jgi:Protein of unknown function (DUF2752)